jgi:haloalkane dehalogenase
MRTPTGEQIILVRNVFVERILPASVIRRLRDEEMEVYRRPYLEPGESRRPTLTWPREIPIEGERADVVQIVESYARWLADSDLPKLFIYADPGSILTGAHREFCCSWPHQEEVTVSGVHFVQEDSPVEIGTAISSFLERIS